MRAWRVFGQGGNGLSRRAKPTRKPSPHWISARLPVGAHGGGASTMTPGDEPKEPIAALRPRCKGQQFVLYGDACSGVPGALHEGKLASVNAVIRRLVPQPEFIIFPGDEIIGLVADPEELRAQWRHFLRVEMGWLDRK